MVVPVCKYLLTISEEIKKNNYNFNTVDHTCRIYVAVNVLTLFRRETLTKTIVPITGNMIRFFWEMIDVQIHFIQPNKHVYFAVCFSLSLTIKATS